MTDAAKIMYYNMALQGLMPGISDLIVSSKEFQGFARRGVELMALVTTADAEVDAIQAKANADAQAILQEANAKAQALIKQANDRVDAVQKRVRTAHHELAAEVRDFFTEHRLEALLDAAKLPAPPAAQGVVKPSTVHVLGSGDPPAKE